MSLKAFHLIFICAAIALAFGCGVWALKQYWSPDGTVPYLLGGIGAFAAGVGLILYERYFLKKTRKLGYL